MTNTTINQEIYKNQVSEKKNIQNCSPLNRFKKYKNKTNADFNYFKTDQSQNQIERKGRNKSDNKMLESYLMETITG